MMKRGKIVGAVVGGVVFCCSGTAILGVVLPSGKPVTTVLTAPLAPAEATRAAAVAQSRAAAAAVAESRAAAAAVAESRAAAVEVSREALEAREARKARDARQAREAREAREADEARREQAAERDRARAAEAEDVYYANCSAVRAAGADPIRSGDPGYARHLDRDGDGVGCE